MEGGRGMRYKLYFELENNRINIQYRKNFLSFIKKAVYEYSDEYYKKLYNDKECTIKPYTFAIFLNIPIFKDNNIELDKNVIEMNISIESTEIAILLYNAIKHQKNIKFSLDNNSMTLTNIEMLYEKEINSNEIKIKFLSPLVVLDKDRETKKDYFYSYGHEKFLETLKINIREELKISTLSENVLEDFNIKMINAKKVIVKFYEKKIECTTGSFVLSGNIELLNYLYKAGMGSKRSSGFGMFTIIN